MLTLMRGLPQPSSTESKQALNFHQIWFSPLSERAIIFGFFAYSYRLCGKLNHRQCLYSIAT